MRVIIQKTYDEMSQWAAKYIAKTINEYNPTADDPFVLGLPTGGTPVGTYNQLIQLHKAGRVSFKHVVTFNMDEYVGIPKDHPQSYNTYMWHTFFKHVDILQKNIHIPNGNAADVRKECKDYEKAIKDVGGINLFLGGVGSDGHIAFNEPFSSLTSVTRLKTLTYETKVANSRFFDDDINKVPPYAITVGLKTILDADQVLFIVSGLNKALPLQVMVEGPISQSWPCSHLQTHPKAVVVCDDAATGELKVSTYRYFLEIEARNIDPTSLEEGTYPRLI
ncbi:MAG: glucosamine-6-phosphate deaminase [Sphaerochaetaceae bacterium]|jgi:glucosamine-6-phosphate deaminase